MKTYEIIIDFLESARIHAGAEFEKFCKNKEYTDACIFQGIRDSIEQNIQLLKSYSVIKSESEVK